MVRKKAAGKPVGGGDESSSSSSSSYSGEVASTPAKGYWEFKEIDDTDDIVDLT